MPLRVVGGLVAAALFALALTISTNRADPGIASEALEARLAQLERQNAEMGREIALLRGRLDRAESFTLALDQMDHPERYAPARPDIAISEEVAR